MNDVKKSLNCVLLGVLLAASGAQLTAAPEPGKPVAAAQATSPQASAAAPQTSARAFVLQDFNSGYVLAQGNADERLEPASLTKLMTAYVVFKELAAGNIQLDDQVPISERAWRTQGSRTFVQVNTKVALEDLLKGMIIQSGNDASVALAEHVAGSEEGFAALMNRETEKLGMHNSHFTNSTGLPDPELYVTARDIGRLARAIIHHYPQYYKYYSIKEFTYNDITQYNRNKLLWRDVGADGVKTGHTETAGYCLVSSALRDDMRLIAVVMGTASENMRADESQELLNYGFRFFETHRLYDDTKPLSTTKVWKGASKTLPLGIEKELYVTVPRGEYKKLGAAMEIDKTIVAPVQQGRTYGRVKITLGKRVIGTQPLVALNKIEQGGLWRRLIDTIWLWFA